MTSTFLFSLLTSFKSAFPSSTAQSCSSNCRKSGPLNHLPFISVTEMPFVKSSATFSNVGQATNLRASCCTESHRLGRKQRVCSFDSHLESMRVQSGYQSSSVLVQTLIGTLQEYYYRGGFQSRRLVTPNEEYTVPLKARLWNLQLQIVLQTCHHSRSTLCRHMHQSNNV